MKIKLSTLTKWIDILVLTSNSGIKEVDKEKIEEKLKASPDFQANGPFIVIGHKEEKRAWEIYEASLEIKDSELKAIDEKGESVTLAKLKNGELWINPAWHLFTQYHIF